MVRITLLLVLIICVSGVPQNEKGDEEKESLVLNPISNSAESCGIGCVRKCCKSTETFKLDEDGTFKCTTAEWTNWSPILYVSPTEQQMPGNSSVTHESQFQFLSSHPREEWCSEDPYILSTILFEDAKYLIRILVNGSVIVKNHPLHHWKFLKSGSFCIEGIQPNNITPTATPKDLVVVDCSAIEEEVKTNLIIYVIFQAIACVFLLITVLVYITLWERQNIHSWTLLGYAICVLCLHSCLFANYAYNDSRIYRSESVDSFCTGLAISIHFFYLSMICWLTLINFDVWWTFNYLQVTIGGSKRKRRFFMYFLFAILVPVIVICVGVVLDNLYKDDFDSSVVFPDYGGSNCYINFQTSSAFYYMVLPTAILMACNLIFFFHTIYTLHKISEMTKFATNKSSQAETAKPRFLLFFKLFFVMGLFWSLEVVSYCLFNGSQSVNPLAILFDIIPILQPIAIFIIFVCKSDVLRGLQIKFPIVRPIFQRFGLQQIPNRHGSGGSSVSVATQVSTCSTRSTFSGRDQAISLGNMARLKI